MGWSKTGTKCASGESKHQSNFAETQWKDVLLAGQTTNEYAIQAKERLCVVYWPAIYGFLRHKGHSIHDAEDLTQQFFVRFIGNDSFSKANPSKGRFRNFLLGALKHFLVDANRKTAAKKRGGELSFISADCPDGEMTYLEVHDTSLSPDQVYDQRWASVLLTEAFRLLCAEFNKANQSDRFKLLNRYLSEDPAQGDYDRLALQLKISPKAVSSAVCRFRQRYREVVRLLVANTLAGTENVDKELQDLLA